MRVWSGNVPQTTLIISDDPVITMLVKVLTMTTARTRWSGTRCSPWRPAPPRSSPGWRAPTCSAATTGTGRARAWSGPGQSHITLNCYVRQQLLLKDCIIAFTKGRRIHTKRFFFLSIYSIYVSNVLRSTEPAISRYRIKTKVLFHWLEDWHSRPNPQHMLTTFTDNLVRQTWVVRSSESILYLEFYITGLILL